MQTKIKTFDMFFWLIIGLLLIFLHLSHGQLNSDNGIFLAGAWSLSHHLNIYKDFFSFTSPGTYYLLLLVWKIFTINYWSAWFAAIISLLASSYYIFKITDRLNRQSSYLAVLLFCLNTISWPIITAHIFCLPFILSAIYFFILGLENNKINFIYLAGCLAGVSIIFLQTIGMATLSILILYLIWQFIINKSFINFKRLLIFILSSILPILLLFLKWSPLILFNNLIKFPLLHYTATLAPTYRLLALNFLWLSIFFLILKRKYRKSLTLKLLFIWQCILFLSTFSLPDFAHLSFVMMPLLILFSVLSQEIYSDYIKINKYFILRYFSAFTFLAYFLIYFFIAIYLASSPFFTFKNDTPTLITFIKENCQDQYIYAGPLLPQIYFFTQKLAPGPSHWLLTNHHSSEQFSQTLLGLKTYQPSCAIIDYKMVKKFNYNSDNEVDNYIKDNYKVFKKFNDLIIMRRIE